MNSHDKDKRYHEYLAKLILEELFPEIYQDLTIGEKPDLRNSIGNNVEVTKAPYNGDEEASNLFSRIKGSAIDEISDRTKERFHQLGYEFHEINGRVLGHTLSEAIWETTKEIERASEKKLSKIDQYSGDVDLFIYAPTFDSYDERMIQEFAEGIAEKCTDSEKYFHIIYVFDYTSIYICKIDDASSKRLIIENEIVKGLVEKARRFVNAT